MAEEIIISTVMLCWNRLFLTKRSLKSYLETISVPSELFVMNNASTDETGDYLESLRDHPRINDIIHMPTNDPAAALNLGLSRCTGKYLHVMEKDFIYVHGCWDYVLHCFEKLPGLGQLAVCIGPPHLLGEKLNELVIVSKSNVGSSSYFRRELFFSFGTRWKNVCRGTMPDDYGFSHHIKRIGFLVAWPTQMIADNVGHYEEEYRRDPTYYIRNMRLKLFSEHWIRGMIKSVVTFDTDVFRMNLWKLTILTKLYLYKIMGRLK